MRKNLIEELNKLEKEDYAIRIEKGLVIARKEFAKTIELKLKEKTYRCNEVIAIGVNGKRVKSTEEAIKESEGDNRFLPGKVFYPGPGHIRY